VSSAEDITKKSQSNLSWGFCLLSKERQNAIHTLYAFCRVIDDIADNKTLDTEQKQKSLESWRRVVAQKETKQLESLRPLAEELISLQKKYHIKDSLLETIIDGVESDLTRQRITSQSELEQYCYQVAGAVGLASLQIFGCEDPECREYAMQLGYFLQTVNIMRDVKEDFTQYNRVYLPAEDLALHGYSIEDLESRVENKTWQSLMRAQCQRAREYRNQSLTIYKKLNRSERRKLLTAEIMAAIYSSLLKKMEKAQFSTLSHRFSLSKVHKIYLVLCKYINIRFST